MSYQGWSVVFGETPSASKWNIIGSNMAGFNDGTAIGDDAIITRHLADGSVTPAALLAGTGTTWPWTSYTPSNTNITVGTGGGAQNAGWYKQIGKTVLALVKIKLGTSGQSMGSNPYIGLPVAASSNFSQAVSSANIILGQCWFYDANGANYPGHVTINNAGGLSSAQLLIETVNGTYPTMGGISSTVPYTWAAGDEAVALFAYEAA